MIINQDVISPLMMVRISSEIATYAVGSMIYMDIIMAAFIIMFGVFGTWGT